jgi:hypothetical protein
VRRGLPLILAALALAGCGGKGERGVVAKTADKIGQIRSGTLHVELLVTPHAPKATTPFGYKLDGPFAFGDKPTAKVRYTQIANGKEGTATLVLDGSGGSVITETGARRPMSAAQVASLRAQMRAVHSGGVLNIDDWVKSAHTTSCSGASAGVRCVSGDLDPVKLVNGLAGLAGPGFVVSGAEEKQLRDAMRSATYYLATGKQDSLLRDLRVNADLGLNVPQSLSSALGSLVGATFEFRLAVDRPNGLRL